MPPVVIENPILNSPEECAEPTRHFRFTEEGITNENELPRGKPRGIRLKRD